MSQRRFWRLVGAVRRASEGVRRALVVVLLALAYVAVVPAIFLARSLAGRPGRGLQPRVDPEVGELTRLRRGY